MSKTKPTYQQLEKRLAAAEPIIEALKHHEVDAVVGEGKIAFLLLRKVEEALLESNEEFRAMFELSGVGMVQADTPGFRFTRVNQKFCEIAGYSAEELLTKTYIGLTHPQDRQRDMNGLARVLRAKTDSWSIEKRCVRKDGSTVWVDVNGVALRDATGRAVRIMAMISDITARKQAEQVLRDRSEQLRKLASELILAEHRERRRIARILHDHLEELLVGVKRRMAPSERAEEKTVRQALKDVRDLIDRFIGLPRDKSPAEKGKPMRLKKATVKKARESARGKSSDKPRLKRR
jgi:PAS domain S-box-containing protein